MQPWKVTGKMQQSDGVRITGMRYMSLWVGFNGDTSSSSSSSSRGHFPGQQRWKQCCVHCSSHGECMQSRTGSKYSKMNHGKEGAQLDECGRKLKFEDCVRSAPFTGTGRWLHRSKIVMSQSNTPFGRQTLPLL
jgi:hypothetical protein